MANPELLALFPLEVVLFPGMALPLHIFEPRYRQMIGECLTRHEPFGVVLETAAGRTEVGCSAAIERVVNRYPDGRLDILTEGKQRFRILTTDEGYPYLRATVEWLEDAAEDLASERAEALDLYRRTYWAHAQGLAPSQIAEAPTMSFVIARSSLLDVRDRQKLLELGSERERLGALSEAMRELEPVARLVGGNGHVGKRN